MPNGKTTLEVRKETKDRINAIKGPMTTDELLNLALDHLPPDQVAKVYEGWKGEAMRALKTQPNLRERLQRFLRSSSTGAKQPPAPRE